MRYRRCRKVAFCEPAWKKIHMIAFESHFLTQDGACRLTRLSVFLNLFRQQLAALDSDCRLFIKSFEIMVVQLTCAVAKARAQPLWLNYPSQPQTIIRVVK